MGHKCDYCGRSKVFSKKFKCSYCLSYFCKSCVKNKFKHEGRLDTVATALCPNCNEKSIREVTTKTRV